MKTNKDNADDKKRRRDEKKCLGGLQRSFRVIGVNNEMRQTDSQTAVEEE